MIETANISSPWRFHASTPVDQIPVLLRHECVSGPETASAFPTQHFQTRPNHPYTQRWMTGHILLPHNRERGLALLEQGTVQYNRFEPTPLRWNSTQWNENPFGSRNWEWCHHQLMAVHYLMAAAGSHPGSRQAAMAMVRSWAAANCNATFPSNLSWNDHATAFRVRTLLCLFEFIRTEEPPKVADLQFLLALIGSHCRVLADPEFFSRHTNHGFDQGIILYWAASAFPELVESASWLTLAQKRVDEEIAFMFTTEGIHVENSPSYHVWMLMGLEEYLLLSQENASPALRSLINNGWRYAAHVLQPDGRLPLVGDTETRDFASSRSTLGLPAFQDFLYSGSRGVAGVRPPSADAVFPASGYAIFRDQWHEPNRFADTVYLFFKCAHFSDYHRHDDDLQLVLLAFGEEWLIDSGLFGYEEAHPIRRYMRSAAAHNSVIPPGVEAIRRLTRQHSPGSGIRQHELTPSRSSVTAVSRMYPGFQIERQLEYQRPHRIILRDNVRATEAPAQSPGGFRILFHFPADKQITRRSESEVIVTSPSGHQLTLVFQPAPHRMLQVTGESGGHPDLPGSWVSARITQLAPSHCLELEFKDTDSATSILTLLPAGGQLGEAGESACAPAEMSLRNQHFPPPSSPTTPLVRENPGA